MRQRRRRTRRFYGDRRGADGDGASFTTETKEELMKHVELHANEAHPDVDLQPEQVEALVKSSD